MLQFGLVYEPYDFYIVNMRGVASSMDGGRGNLAEVPAMTVIDCSLNVRSNINGLPRCVADTNYKWVFVCERVCVCGCVCVCVCMWVCVCVRAREFIAVLKRCL